MFITLTISRAAFVNKRLHGAKVIVNASQIESMRRSSRDKGTTIVAMLSGSSICVMESPESILKLTGGPDLNFDPPAPHVRGFKPTGKHAHEEDFFEAMDDDRK